MGPFAQTVYIHISVAFCTLLQGRRLEALFQTCRPKDLEASLLPDFPFWGYTCNTPRGRGTCFSPSHSEVYCSEKCVRCHYHSQGPRHIKGVPWATCSLETRISIITRRAADFSGHLTYIPDMELSSLCAWSHLTFPRPLWWGDPHFTDMKLRHTEVK